MNPREYPGSKPGSQNQTSSSPDINTTNNWQRYGESNPELVIESHSCYHYTISPLAGIARIELNFFRVKAECNKPLYDIPVLKNNVVKDCMTYTTNNIRFIIVVFCSSLIPSFWFVSISANL